MLHGTQRRLCDDVGRLQMLLMRAREAESRVVQEMTFGLFVVC